MERLGFAVFLAVCWIVGTVVVCAADQPQCTGDRHYDGVACCPAVDPPPTTTTTLVSDPPSDPPTCESIPGCIAIQDIPPCQDVQCGSPSGANVGVVNITVNRCPTVVFPTYQACFIPRAHQHLLPHDKLVQRNGVWMVCPKRTHPRRVFAPIP